jgi:cation transport regulator ChaC
VEWPGTLTTLFGLAGTIGGFLGFLSYGRQRVTTELWKEEAGALRNRLNTTHEEYVTCKADAEAAKKNLAFVEAQLDRLVTQQPAVEKLALAIGKQHQEVIKGLTDVTNQLSHLTEAIVNKANLGDIHEAK